MILVDTSVWIEHLRLGSARLRSLLYNEQVLCHPFVVGELACGTLQTVVKISLTGKVVIVTVYRI